MYLYSTDAMPYAIAAANQSPCREIPLSPYSRNIVAIVDASDYDLLICFRWLIYKTPRGKTFYAVRSMRLPNGKYRHVRMHRQIMGYPDGFEVDHWDRDGLNNRRYNLRIATRSQNACNQEAQANNTSGIKGVSIHKKTGKWQVQISAKGVRHNLGLFPDLESARAAYIDAAKIMHGEFGRW